MSIWSNRPHVASTPPPSSVPIEYRTLHHYLDTRFADTVVLTFAEIEDLLGFVLPDVARSEPGWWTNADDGAASSEPSQSWTAAHRRATVNMRARTVSFERAPA